MENMGPLPLTRYNSKLVSTSPGRRTYTKPLGSCDQSAVLELLGAFAKLPKAIISFVMRVYPPVRPSVPMEQLSCHWKKCR